MRQDTNDTRTLVTCWRVADDCCTDERTRRRETYQDKEGEKKSRYVARHKSKKIVLKASIVTKLSVSATKLSRGPGQTICHLPALVDNGIKCQ